VAALLTLGLLAAALPGPALAARAERLDLRRLELELDGPPATVLPADLTGDGRPDLLIVTAFSYWGETGTYSTEEVDGQVWEKVEVLPYLIDRREFQLYVAGDDGTYQPAAPPQDLPFSVLAFDVGPKEHPILALTDSGLSAVRFDAAASEAPLSFEPLIDDPPVFAGSRTLQSGYDFTSDLDGDGTVDVLLPARDGPAIYMGEAGGLQTTPRTRLSLPGDATGKDGVVWRRYPIPDVQDVDGDGIPDLVIFHKAEKRRLARFENYPDLGAISVLRGMGSGRFEPARDVRSARYAEEQELEAGEAVSLLLSRSELPGGLSHFGDLDGDGRAELVTYEEIERESKKDGFRQEMKEAKRPLHKYRFYRLREDFRVEPEPYLEFTAQGYPFVFDWLEESPGGFVDLDGDSRKDLVTADLDFSLWQLPKILVARTIGAGLIFHVWAQQEDGTFREVKDSQLRGKMKINLSQVKLVEFAQFAGDFDGDGRTDFVHLGGGRKVSIHRGQTDAHYPKKPDVIIALNRAPDDTGLVKVLDLDGDEHSDLMVVTILNPDEEGETRPTRVEFYLTGGGS
jgi:hypothetical protein